MKNSIYEKLLCIQNELKVPKAQFNAFGKYYFRNAEDIVEFAKPILQKNGCCLTLSDELVFFTNNFPAQIIKTGKDDKNNDIIKIYDNSRFYVKATAILTDGENEIKVSAFAREDDYRKGMDAGQLTGATSSYARKYALNGLFCLDDNKDLDTNNNNQEKKVITKTVNKTANQSKESRKDNEPCPNCDNPVKILESKKGNKYWRCSACGTFGYGIKKQEDNNELENFDEEIPF